MADAEGEKAPTAGLDIDRIAARLRPLGSPVRLRLLRFLTQPHYLEEIARYLRMNRYAAKRHVDVLVEIGLIRSVASERESGPVRDYLVEPQSIFELYDGVRALGELRPAPETFAQTLPGVLTRTKAAGVPTTPRRVSGTTPYLVAVYGAEIGRAFPLVPKREASPHWTLGRDPKSDVPLDLDPFASNRHARVAQHGIEYVLVDAYSTNGTWLNWERLAEGESVPLRHGDIVGVGKTLLVFHRETT